VHPLAYLVTALVNDRQRANRPRPTAGDPLPPIDEATLRAWRAWAGADAAGETWPASSADRSATTAAGPRREIRPADGPA
jgi:hypothetical protein